jgi:hypothetical protein
MPLEGDAMQIPKSARTAFAITMGVALGSGLAAAAALASAGTASAKPRGGGFKVIDCNVAGLDGVFQNAVIELVFTSEVAQQSVDPAIIQVREMNSSATGFTKQVPGSFQFAGNIVRFYPRLPTHLRDPETDDFYAFGAPRDDADANAALKASTSYEVKVVGGAAANTVRSTRGRRLGKTYKARFSTTPSSPASDAFTIETYGDAPPPGFQFSNPSDKVASAEDYYERHGGTRDVPNAIQISLFGNRVPLSPKTVRQGTNVSLQLTERAGDPSFQKPIRGAAYVEQNNEGTRLAFRPSFPLPDRGTYALRVTKDVKDLTEQYDFRANPERLRLRDIFEFMQTAQQLSPGTPPADLPDPPIELIFDWPTDPVERGILKTNVLALGQAYPYEVDPRVMVLFSTRDEPVSAGAVTLEFNANDGYLDAANSTASYGDLVTGQASAVLTIAGGSGVDGDFNPGVDQSINIDNFPNRTINWRKVNIPPNVIVRITGTRPATIKCFALNVDGEFRADGIKGSDGPTSPSYSTATFTQYKGGAGGPGGGAGGDSSSTTFDKGGDGKPGVDPNGFNLIPGDGGQGGQGGQFTRSGVSQFSNGGGGGGGGARIKGEDGAASKNNSPTWTQSAGGLGGAGSSNTDLNPFGGGAGGGAGGAGAYVNQNWGAHGAGGGGGGGALLVQTSGDFTVGTTGAIRARGGAGGRGSVSQYNQWETGPGAGGGGGSLLLRTTKGFNLTNAAAATDVTGGARGTAGTGGPVYGASYGGAGGSGYVVFEDPNGAGSVAASSPGSFGGVYDPVGGGVPSYIYTKWIDTGVDGPRMVEFNQVKDFVLSAAGNDALLIEMQMTIEDPKNFGAPLLTAIDPTTGASSDIDESSNWTPVRIVDVTGKPGGAFGTISGYDPLVNGTDYVFPIGPVLNGHNYKFFRVRIRFQLDETQTVRDPFPYVDKMLVNFEFNI